MMTARDFENRTSAVPFNRTARVYQKAVGNPGFDEIECLVGTGCVSNWAQQREAATPFSCHDTRRRFGWLSADGSRQCDASVVTIRDLTS